MTDGISGRTPFRDVAGILLLGILLLAPQLFLRDIWGPDETRFAEVTREMAVRGHWLVPHLNGAIYAEKPPLYFWCAAALRGPFGADAGRVVSFLYALVSLGLIYVIGRRLYGREEGLWAARIAATTLLFVGLGSAGILDSMLLTAILATIACGLAALESGKGDNLVFRPFRIPGFGFRISGLWWLGAYAAAAAAILTKGPIGLAIPAVVLLTHAVACRRQVRAGGWWHLGGALLMLALIAAWLVPACLSGGEAYARKIVLQQTLERVSGSAAIHGEPPHYYLIRWPLFLWPWSLLVPLAIVAALRAAWRDGAWRAAWPALWFLAVFVLLSAISGKGERYFLPAVPAAALACAHYLCRGERHPLSLAETALRARHEAGTRRTRDSGCLLPWPRWHRGLLAATWLVVLALGAVIVALALAPDAFLRASGKESAAAAMFRQAFTPAHAAMAAALGAGLIAAGVLALLRLWRGVGERRHGGMLVGVVVALSLGFNVVALPGINRFKSDRLAAAHFRPYLDQAEEFCLFRTEFDGIFNLYTGRERIKVVETAEGAAGLLASPSRVVIALWKSQVERLDPAGRYRVIPSGPHSLRSLVLLVNFP